MLCQKCGRQIPDHSIFCLFCGQPVTSAWKSEAPIIDVTPARSKRPIFASVAGLFAFALAGFLLAAYRPAYNRLAFNKAETIEPFSGQKQNPEIAAGQGAAQLLPKGRTLAPDGSTSSYVHTDSGEGVLVYTSSSAFQERSALRSIDRQGIAALLLWGEAFLVDNNTRVSVLHSSSAKAEIQVTSGKYAGKKGWISSALVRYDGPKADLVCLPPELSVCLLRRPIEPFPQLGHFL